MSLWRQEAFERLPEFRKELQEEKSPYCFLSILRDRLVQAYKEENFERIERIKEYVFRLARAKEGHDASSDLGTIVAVSFFEHLPESKLIRQDIGRWFSVREIEQMKEIFTYHGTEEQYADMLSSAKTFTTKKRSNNNRSCRAEGRSSD